MLRRSALVGAALALAVAGCGATPDAEQSSTPTTAPPPATADASPGAPEQPAADPPAADPIPIDEAVGQMIVTRYHGETPTPSVLRALREGQAGGVILFADNVPSSAVTRRAVRQLIRAAVQGDRPRPLILVDQEGGDVKRLRQLPPDVSAAEVGASPSPYARALREGRKTGRALRRLGIDVDLAPVADVPDRASTFLGTRSYSRSPETVARAACGFAEGLQEERVSAALKHFPGLGRAVGNTDLEPVTIDATAAELEADLRSYERCGGDVDFVMLSSAAYPSLGIRRPAVSRPRPTGCWRSRASGG